MNDWWFCFPRCYMYNQDRLQQVDLVDPLVQGDLHI